MNKTVLVIAAVAVVIIGGYFLLGGAYQTPEVSRQPSEIVIPTESLTTPATQGDEVVIEVEGEKQGVNEIEMRSGSLFFNPKTLTLKKGEPVKITFQNSGRHTFTIDELGVDEPLRGNSATVEFTPTKSGSFEYYCAIPGHREGGMAGKLTVN